MPVKVCVATSTRADYGILSPLLRRLRDDPFFELTIAATGTHLLDAFGHTVDDIVADGYEPERISIMEGELQAPTATSDIMALALTRFARFFAERRFDLLIVLGDRFEMEAICCAAVNTRLPIAHLHGGETTQGAIDECYRHAITKMSLLHFPCCELYRQRILQLGEQPERVFNVGALGVENLLRVPDYPMERLSEELRLPLADKPYAVVTFHPVTQESGTALTQLHALMDAMDARDDLLYVVTKSNADEGGAQINQAWDEYGATRGSCAVVASLGMRRYLTALRGCAMALGNSSSGILEAPIARVPTVNIGDRQKGRMRTGSIVDCAPDTSTILEAMTHAQSESMRRTIEAQVCPYGDGHTSEQITAILRQRCGTPLNVKKEFYDMGASQ